MTTAVALCQYLDLICRYDDYYKATCPLEVGASCTRSQILLSPFILSTMSKKEEQLCERETVNALQDAPGTTTPTTTEIAENTYPPQDGGKQAWLFLFGACIIEITAWGIVVHMIYKIFDTNNS